jgi:hypothetical protein
MGNTTGRKLSDRGQIGVNTIPLTSGCISGPPAEREYAVDPVGVAMISLHCRELSVPAFQTMWRHFGFLC